MFGIWSKLRAVGRIGLVAACAAPLLAVQVAVAGPVFNDYETIPRLLKRGLLRIMGIKVTFNGAAAPGARPTIYAANHMSYLDIIVLGSGISGAFVAKREVRDWPVIGWAANCIGTIFTERRIGTLRRDQKQVVKALNSGRDVILFPEGAISSEGVLPFKGGLLCVAFNNVSRLKLDGEIYVRPVSVRVTRVNDVEENSRSGLRQLYPWFGGQDIAGHFWRLAQIDSMDIEITLHPVMNPADFTDRRVFAKAVEKMVRCAA